MDRNRGWKGFIHWPCANQSTAEALGGKGALMPKAHRHLGLYYVTEIYVAMHERRLVSSVILA